MLVVDLRLVREGEVARLRRDDWQLLRREAALGTPRRERAGAQRAEGPGGQHRGGSAVEVTTEARAAALSASHCQLRLLYWRNFYAERGGII